MPLSTFVAGTVIRASALNTAFALCVLTDTSRTITVTHTYTASQTFSAGWTGTTGSLSSTLGVTGVATFTAQPIISSLTASQAVFTDGSKGLVSNATTGSGNVVMSASPTLTGTATVAGATFSAIVKFGAPTNIGGATIAIANNKPLHVNNASGTTVYPSNYIDASDVWIGAQIVTNKSWRLLNSSGTAIFIFNDDQSFSTQYGLAISSAGAFSGVTTIVTTDKVSIGSNGLDLTGNPAAAAASHVNIGGAVQTTIGANGAASALTANPLGYLKINVAGTSAIVPYYNA